MSRSAKRLLAGALLIVLFGAGLDAMATVKCDNKCRNRNFIDFCGGGVGGCVEWVVASCLHCVQTTGACFPRDGDSPSATCNGDNTYPNKLLYYSECPETICTCGGYVETNTITGTYYDFKLYSYAYLCK
ncbi:MAG TPA: hypothetical protein VEL76_38540 [Gemmataceae bacterium]|nr:hypothetical protein [Gemmataceae bacterium]